METSKFSCLSVGLLLYFVVAVTPHQFHSSGGRGVLQTPEFQNTVIERYSTVYVDITTQLRAAILNGELDTAIALLVVSKDVNGLAAGLRFSQSQADQYFRITPQRVNDPDVITIKALAGASLRLSDCGWKSSLADDPTTTNPQVLGVLKIAQVSILAITPENGVFPQDVNKFELQLNMINAFSDRTFMQQILNDNPTQSSLNRRRMLIQNASPVRTWFCGHCYPLRFCKRTTWWCPKR